MRRDKIEIKEYKLNAFTREKPELRQAIFTNTFPKLRSIESSRLTRKQSQRLTICLSKAKPQKSKPSLGQHIYNKRVPIQARTQTI